MQRVWEEIDVPNCGRVGIKLTGKKKVFSPSFWKEQHAQVILSLDLITSFIEIDIKEASSAVACSAQF